MIELVGMDTNLENIDFLVILEMIYYDKIKRFDVNENVTVKNVKSVIIGILVIGVDFSYQFQWLP